MLPFRGGSGQSFVIEPLFLGKNYLLCGTVNTIFFELTQESVSKVGILIK